MCLAQVHNAVTPLRFEPAAPLSPVKHSTTEPLRSPKNIYGGAEILLMSYHHNTEKPVYNSHSKIDKTKILMKVESIAEIFAPPGAFCNTFDLH